MRRPLLRIVEPEGIKDIAFGHCHGVYITKTGQVKSWGKSTYGETGNAKAINPHWDDDTDLADAQKQTKAGCQHHHQQQE